MGKCILKKPWGKIFGKLWYYDRIIAKLGFLFKKNETNRKYEANCLTTELFPCLCNVKQLNRYKNKSNYWVLVKECSIFKVYDSKKFINATYLYKVRLGKLHI